MTTDVLIPTPGAYNLWLTGADDYDVWCLPIIGLAPHLVSYSGEPDEELSVEYQPVVIDHSGNVHELNELDGPTAPRLFLGGYIVGVAPAAMDTNAALAHLARFRVPLDPHAPGQDDDEDSLFDDHDVDHQPDPAERRAARRLVLAGVLQNTRTENGWSVNDAASKAAMAPMTWRRLEEGLDVRRRAHASVDSVLGLQFGTTGRALADDEVMLEVVRHVDPVRVAGVKPDEVAGFLDEMAERFRTGTASPMHHRRAMVDGVTTVEMGTPIERAQRQARRQYVWPQPWQPAA